MSFMRVVFRFFSLASVAVSLVVTMVPGAGGAASARPNSSTGEEHRLSLSQLVSLAQRRNLRVTDAGLAIREKEHSRRSSYSEFFPTIDLSYTATWYRYMQGGYIGGFSAELPSLDPFQNFSAGLTVTQPIYSGGKAVNDYKNARLGVEHAALQYEVDRQNLTLDVTTAYYKLVQGESMLKVANASIRALEAVRKRAQDFFREGMVFKSDVLAAEAQLAQGRNQKTRALADIDKAKANLNFLVRNPQRTALDVVQDFDYHTNPYKEPQIYYIARDNRVEIRQAEITARQAITQVNSANADLLPNVKLQLQGIRTNGDWNVFDPHGSNDWSMQALFGWSFDMFRRRETVKERRTAVARAVTKRDQLAEQIMEEVAIAYTDMRRAESDISNNRKAVDFRRENFRITRARYDEKMATYIEVLEAERQLFQAEAEYYGSLIDYRINLAILERKMGVLK